MNLLDTPEIEKTFNTDEETSLLSEQPVKTTEETPENKKHDKLRHKYFNELNHKVPRYVAITFTYSHNYIDKFTNVSYGASIFTKENAKDTLNKKQIMSRSMERFECPNSFSMDFVDDAYPKYNEVTAKIRKMMMSQGCCAKK